MSRTHPITECICGADIREIELDDGEVWIHVNTSSRLCYPDQPEDVGAVATPLDAE